MLQASPVVASLFSLGIVVILLLNFVMVGSRWLKNYVIAFAAESCLIAVLAIAMAYFGSFKDLYVVGLLTLLFRGLILPYLLSRMIAKLSMKQEFHTTIPASSSLIFCVVLVAFAFTIAMHIAGRMHVVNPVLIIALMAMLSIQLTGFFLLAVRDQAISKILALLVLENGIFLGSIFLVPGMPMFIELVILFDLLIVVAGFGVLVHYVETQVGSTSTQQLNRLVG